MNIPTQLQAAIDRALSESYGELYEEGDACLEDTLREMLVLLGEHPRYLWMALILCFTVQPTFIYYQPDNPLPEFTIRRLITWLREGPSPVEEILPITYHTTRRIPSLQILAEAQDVYQRALSMDEYERCVDALLEMLEDCLEGYAIFPGSEGRRELFNWWLLVVVPASWYLQVPISFYCVDVQALDKGWGWNSLELLESVARKL